MNYESRSLELLEKILKVLTTHIERDAVAFLCPERELNCHEYERLAKALESAKLPVKLVLLPHGVNVAFRGKEEPK